MNEVERLAERVRFFLPTFEASGARLYRYLTLRAGTALEWPAEPFTQALAPFVDERPERFLWLRVLALVHRWVLAGELPQLRIYYPSAGGTIGPVARTWELFRDAVVARADELPGLLALPHQHNEVGRAVPLARGFLHVSSEMSMPLRLLEVGASAGLLLRWDHYLHAVWPDVDGLPSMIGDVRVEERRGCDLHPVDPVTADGRLYLHSMVWADLVEHLDALDRAIAICAEVPAKVDQADGADWLVDHARPRPGAATVVYHSLMRASCPPESLSRIEEAVERGGRMASAEAPFAYLRFEAAASTGLDVDSARRLVEVRLTTWPGGNEGLLATCDVNGRNLRCLR